MKAGWRTCIEDERRKRAELLSRVVTRPANFFFFSPPPSSPPFPCMHLIHQIEDTPMELLCTFSQLQLLRGALSWGSIDARLI